MINDPEPCPYPITRKSRCGANATILTIVRLTGQNGHQLSGVRKLCLTHSSQVAVKLYLEKVLRETDEQI